MPSKTSNTKEFVEIADIRDTMVLLKNGSLRSILEVTSINFDLKSQDEQQGIIAGFQNFLNAIDFPLQVLVSSRRLNMTHYLQSLDEVLEKQTGELMKVQIQEYSRFVKGLSELANIMAKHFYIVVPYYVTESTSAPSSGGLFSGMMSVIKPKKFVKQIKEEDLEKYRIPIEQRISVIAANLEGLGLRVRVMGQEELVNLYYGYYNFGQELQI